MNNKEMKTKYLLAFLSNPDNEESLNFLVCDAFDGGISYWAGLDNTTPAYLKAKQELIDAGRKNICYEDILTQMLLDGENITLYDVEDETEEYHLNLGKLASGLAQFLIVDEDNEDRFYDYRGDFEAIIEDLDSSDADCIVQYALFDDIIFG